MAQARSSGPRASPIRSRRSISRISCAALRRRTIRSAGRSRSRPAHPMDFAMRWRSDSTRERPSRSGSAGRTTVRYRASSAGRSRRGSCSTPSRDWAGDRIGPAAEGGASRRHERGAAAAAAAFAQGRPKIDGRDRNASPEDSLSSRRRARRSRARPWRARRAHLEGARRRKPLTWFVNGAPIGEPNRGGNRPGSPMAPASPGCR